MLLKSLEIFGFKTFPDKTVLKFNKGISIVVGPNGSGKSNVSDAIRWVLGEQSLRLLRCSKMEDVIFNGTTDRKSKGYAEVSLIIDNKDKKLNLEKDEVIITRRYYRSTESEYLINNKEVRLKDINELFMDTGLGRDGYSIIGQGKIDEVVSSKSEERREIFEEAAGISKIRYRKEEAEKKLVKTEENLIRINDILTELKDRVGPLFEESEKAKEYVNLAKQQKDIQIGLWINNLENSDKSLKELEIKLEGAKKQYSSLEDELNNIVKNTENDLNEITNLNIEIDNETRKNSLAEELKAEKINKISVYKNDILHNKETCKKLISEINEIKNSFLNINEKKEELKKVISDFEINRKSKETDLFEHKKKNIELTNKLASISTEITDLNKSILEINSKSSLNKAKAISIRESIKETENLIITKKEQIDAQKLELNNLKNLLEKIKEKNKLSDEDITNKINLMNNTKKEIQEKRKNLDSLKDTLNKLKLENDSKIRKIEFLKNLKESLEGFAFSVKFIMKESKLGNLSGIYGPVISLLKVDQKYALALETALGASSQYIVTDSENDAKKAIFLLKNKKAGRATFLPLSNISGKLLNDSSLSLCPGFIGIASSLCSYESKFNNIFEHLIGRTLIVDNLDNAGLVAKKYLYKFKIVTLDGQVINAGGSLTGGSQSKNTGVLQREKEAEILIKESEKILLEIKKEKENLENLNNEYEKLNVSLSNIEQELSLKNKENIKLRTEYNSLSFKVNSVSKNVEDAILDKESLENKLKNLKEDESKSLSTQVLDTNAINKLESNLKDLEENRDLLNKEKEKLGEVISKINLDVLAITKDIELKQNSLNMFFENENTGVAKIKFLENEQTSLNEKNEKISKEILVLEDEIKKSAQDYIFSENKIKDLSLKRISIEQNITKFRTKEREISAVKENMSLECARFKDKIDSVQKDCDEIIAKMWDEYEITKTEAMSNFKKLDDITKYNKILSEIKLKIRELGNVNVGAIEEYREVNERYTFLNHQVEDVLKSKKDLNNLINDLTEEMKNLFSNKFYEINKNFDKVFKELFGGGKAELSLSDENDVLNTGINIFVQPPGKIVTHIESLSGGEKALVAISLYFAIMLVNPVPFCVLDEVEAALDDVNVTRFADYLRKMSENTQFIAITHRRGTMEQADMMYGVTMQQKGISKLLELNLEESRVNFHV